MDLVFIDFLRSTTMEARGLCGKSLGVASRMICQAQNCRSKNYLFITGCLKGSNLIKVDTQSLFYQITSDPVGDSEI